MSVPDEIRAARRGWLALVQAGGEGSRLDLEHPKPVAEVGGALLLERVVRQLHQAGASRIFVAVRAGDEVTRERTVARLSDKVTVEWLIERRPLGTIGALGLVPRSPLPIVSANCDVLTGLDHRLLLAEHSATCSDATLATHLERHRLQFGEVVTNELGHALDYREKPEKSYRVSSGVTCWGSRTAGLVSPEERLDVPDLIRRALAAGQRVTTFDHGRRWIDVNTVEDLRRAAALLSLPSPHEGEESPDRP